MTDRERLIELVKNSLSAYGKEARADCKPQDFIADFLIANGVMLPKLKEPPTDLNGKCGSCIYAKPTTFGKSRVYVECTNVEHLGQWCKRQISYKRQRTHKACKRYQVKE
jgi:hypothetical protein